MRAFAELLDRLAYTPRRNAKLGLMACYFRAVPDPDRGWALAALTDGLPFSLPVRRTLQDLMANRVDDELFRLSRDYVGDTAETVALLWPQAQQVDVAPLLLGDVIEHLLSVERASLGDVLSGWLDRLDATGRWALLKLLTGALRVGVSARLAKLAVAQAWHRDVAEIEELWHGLTPPYTVLFQWLEGKAARPDVSQLPVFRPMMLAHPLEEADWRALDLADYLVEWKWDGIRVQIVAKAGVTRLYSRTGDDVTASFPELQQNLKFEGILDGELLIVRDGRVAPFSELQQRLNRKTVSKKLMEASPAHIRFYDVLELNGCDLRQRSLLERRTRLEHWHGDLQCANAGLCMTDLSELIAVSDKNTLREIWSKTREAAIEGLMLKRKASPYLAGRPKGHWFKWKRAPLTLDCVMMYAQRGSGRRSSFYSDYTFGVWRASDTGTAELVPVGKAYSGFTEDELARLDRWVRNNTTERYGPVRAVAASLVLEVAFDSVHRSKRHKSGVAMRFPRIHRIRWDKPCEEADSLEMLVAMIVEA